MSAWCAGLGVQEFFALPLDSRIRLAAAEFLGWRYGTGRMVRFPSARPMLPAKLIREGDGASFIDCSSFTAYILATAVRGAWTPDRYRELQVMDVLDPWSPIAAVVRADAGIQVDPQTIPLGAWALTQAWVDADTRDGDGLSGGHARLVRFHDRDRMLVLESSSRDGGIGPRWAEASYRDLQRRYPAGIRFGLLTE